MSIRVKICGLTTLEDALFAARAGADMLGLNFYPKSKRYLPASQAAQLVLAVREALGADAPLMVGVFVNPTADEVRQVVQQVGLDAVQWSGDESPTLIAAAGGGFKAVRPADAASAQAELARFAVTFPQDERLPSVLLDAHVPGEYGGTGVPAEIALAVQVRQSVPRLMLAGGLTPHNVAERVAAIAPWGVDVASGVEGDLAGRKDPEKVRAFIVSSRAAAQTVAGRLSEG